MSRLSVSLSILAFVLAGCSDRGEVLAPVPEHPGQDGIIPLKVGNYWVYLSSNYDTTGRQYDVHWLDTMRIVRDTVVNGETWYIFNGGVARTNRANGVWAMYYGDIWFELPATLNDSTCTATPSRLCDEYIKLVDTSQQRWIIDTRYNAYVYDWIFKMFNNELGYRYFTVPHLGHVRMETYRTTLSGYHYLSDSEELLFASTK